MSFFTNMKLNGSDSVMVLADTVIQNVSARTPVVIDINVGSDTRVDLTEPNTAFLLDNILNRDTEAEDSVLVESGILERLISQA